ncbi:MAG: hypothetical protein GC191_05705 [Azospirillum sp.]|nr:hypothetical protein [Azospirillum sp.]
MLRDFAVLLGALLIMVTDLSAPAQSAELANPPATAPVRGAGTSAGQPESASGQTTDAVVYTKVRARLDPTYYATPVKLTECAVGEDGVRKKMTEKVEGFASFLHSGHPFSIRSRYWSEINRLIRKQERGQPIDWRNNLDDPGRADTLVQLVFKVLINNKLHPLVFVGSEEKGFAFLPACQPAFDISSAPEDYPSLQLNPAAKADVKSAIKLREALRDQTRTGAALPFFSTGDRSSADQLAVRPLPEPASARIGLTYGDLTVATLASGQADFLEKLRLGGTIAPVTADANVPAAIARLSITIAAADRKPAAGADAAPTAESPDQPAAASIPTPAAKPVLNPGRDGSAGELENLRRQLESAQNTIAELVAQRQALEPQWEELRQLRVRKPRLRLRLPDLFAHHDYAAELRITGPNCDRPVLRRLSDGVSYEGECDDAGAKLVGLPGFAPVQTAGLTIAITEDMLAVDAGLDGPGGWFSYRNAGEPEAARVDGVTLAQLAVDPATTLGAYRFHMFPAARGPLSDACSVDLPIRLDDLVSGRIALDRPPPCAVFRSELPPSWTEGDGAPPDSRCLAAPTAALPWCAQLGSGAGVTVSAGPGWEPLVVPANDLYWPRVKERLRPRWPYAGANPAASDIPDRPTYQFASVGYCSTAASRCCVAVPVSRDDGDRDDDGEHLPPLGAAACPIDAFGPETLPDSISLRFRQSAGSEASLRYRASFEEYLAIAALDRAPLPAPGADRLLAVYPVRFEHQIGLPFTARQLVAFHEDRKGCITEPASGKAEPVHYTPGGPGSAAPERMIDSYAVVIENGRPLSTCARAVPKRIEDRVYATFQFALERVPGRRIALVLDTSDQLAGGGRGRALLDALEGWFGERIVDLRDHRRSMPPISVLSIGSDGQAASVLASEELFGPPAVALATVRGRFAAVSFAGGGRGKMQLLEAAYRNLQDHGVVGDGDPIGSLVLFEDGQGSAFSRTDQAILALIVLADRTALRVITAGDCVKWQKLTDPLAPTQCVRLPAAPSAGTDAGEGTAAGSTAEEVAAVVKAQVGTLLDQAVADAEARWLAAGRGTDTRTR